MKKLFSLLFVAAAFTFTSCGGGEATPEATGDTIEEAPAGEEEEDPAGGEEGEVPNDSIPDEQGPADSTEVED